MASSTGVLGSVVRPIIVLGFLASSILVHELGHYVPARLFGMKIDEFSVGFGPKLFRFHKFGNAFALRAFPFGGYVSFPGEEGEEGGVGINHDDPGLLENRPWYQKVIVSAGGPAFNVLFAILIAVALNARVWKMNQVSFGAKAAFARHLAKRIVTNTVAEYGLLLSTLAKGISGIIALGVQAKGPVGIVQMGANTVAASAASVSNGGLTAVPSMLPFSGLMIAVNCGIASANMLPIPGLDGGNIVEALFEGITGRKIGRKLKDFAESVTAALLLILMFVVTQRDVVGLFVS